MMLLSIPMSGLSGVTGQYSQISVEQSSVVIIGANGSGKTRFGSYIERINPNVTRISAQRALSIPKKIQTFPKNEAEFMLRSNTYSHSYVDNEQHMQQQLNNQYANRWNNNPNTHTLNDYQILLTYLFSSENELAIQSRNNQRNGSENIYIESGLDKIIAIWEAVLPHRRLIKESGKLMVKSNEDNSGVYNSSEMSDGERVIFYLIAQAICAKPNHIIVIDEPEIHIHKSIITTLFDQIENSRKADSSNKRNTFVIRGSALKNFFGRSESEPLSGPLV